MIGRFFLLGGCLFLLGSCSIKPPVQINNACAILAQKDSFFNNWRKAAKNAELLHGIPMPIILATIRIESNFRHNARPPRKKLLGFIPWKRPSTAYGYAQALDETWDHYVRSTGKVFAWRTNFADTADFIAWYHRQSVRRNNISPNDAYNLYLNYHMGHGAYARYRGPSSANIAKKAKYVESLSRLYNQQLKACGRR
ncbi:hypothetical protein BA1379B_013090 [Bartonella sp. A1379B]|uniref:Putative lipoprotein n=1 Tax=Bartonella rochalimae ATCC BAA-1498 TaxID=685782 RepID=E6YJV7_9HYPH|nr:hypothetical protein BA1379B_013090 [Bartonella sp. A1379B]AQX22331.1 hypothetical protein Bho11B_003030 [Bartonella sp. 11B]KEC57360.1 hypothetical protein O99_00008 [Bartonella rochalimae ATCC BAA-1498]CBI77145.1 putative lipoprotein [Bartonella rochalimae ATCC BAA-1498]